ncbi:MAG TPA: hypothetical protein VF654_17210, partial [Pyrinomonadaceae bacterium]
AAQGGPPAHGGHEGHAAAPHSAAGVERVQTGYELNAFLSESRPRRLVKDAVNGLLRLSRLGDSLKIRAERRA